MPRPDRRSTSPAVEKPDAKTRDSSWSIIGADGPLGPGRQEAAGDADLLDAREIRAATVIPDADGKPPAAGCKLQDDLGAIRLALGDPFGGGLHPMADRIAQEVHDRVFESLQHLPVHLDVEADAAHVHVAPLLAGDFADHVTEGAEDGLGRDSETRSTSSRSFRAACSMDQLDCFRSLARAESLRNRAFRSWSKSAQARALSAARLPPVADGSAPATAEKAYLAAQRVPAPPQAADVDLDLAQRVVQGLVGLELRQELMHGAGQLLHLLGGNPQIRAGSASTGAARRFRWARGAGLGGEGASLMAEARRICGFVP